MRLASANRFIVIIVLLSSLVAAHKLMAAESARRKPMPPLRPSIGKRIRKRSIGAFNTWSPRVRLPMVLTAHKPARR